MEFQNTILLFPSTKACIKLFFMGIFKKESLRNNVLTGDFKTNLKDLKGKRPICTLSCLLEFKTMFEKDCIKLIKMCCFKKRFKG